MDTGQGLSCFRYCKRRFMVCELSDVCYIEVTF